MRTTNFPYFLLSLGVASRVALRAWAILFFTMFLAVSSETEQLERKEWQEAHLSLLVPEGWHVLREETDGSPVFHISPEPLELASAGYQVGLAINILQGVPSILGQKPSEYADTLISQIRERNDKEISVRATQSLPFKLYRVEYSILSESETLSIVNILEANDSTGTLYMMVWQVPASQESLFSETREKILGSIQLDPTF